MTLDAPPPPITPPGSTMRRDILSAYAASGMKVLSWAIAAALIFRHDREHFALFVLIRGTLGLLNYTTLGLAPAIIHLLSKARTADATPTQALPVLGLDEGNVLSYANPDLRRRRRDPKFRTRQVIYSAFLLSILAGGLALGAAMLYAVNFDLLISIVSGSSHVAEGLIMILGAGMAIRLASDALGAVLHTFGQIAPDNVTLAVTEAVWIAFMVVLYENALAVAVSFFLASFTPLLMRLIMVVADVGLWWPRASYFHIPTIWKLLSFGFLVSLATLADFMYAPTDYILIDRLLTKESLATYAPAVQIDAALLLLVGGLAGVLLPKTALAHARDDRRLVRRYFIRGTLASFAILLFAGGVVILASPHIFKLWLGDELPATQMILRLVLIHTVVGGSSAVGRSILLGMGKVKAFTVAVLVAGVGNVVLSYCFVRFFGWGLHGIILGTICAVVARCAIWQPWYVWRSLKRI